MHTIKEEIACRKTQQKYQVTIGLKFTTQSTKASEERELQHIRAKSYKLRVNLVDFGGTTQKEQLVYLARGAMSMYKLMANPAHSTIVGI